MEKQKKIALINDLSCVGRSSLTAALPIVSACGFHAVPLPTGVFSSQTAEDGYVYVDISEKLPDFCGQWKNIGLDFDCIYTGYLAGREQAEIVKRFIIDFKKSGTVCVVDPVMGDDGRLYSGIKESMADDMRFLCSVADIILPNVTEAELLTGVTPSAAPYDIEYIKQLMAKTRNLGCPRTVITGIDTGDGQIGCAVYDSLTGKANMFFMPKTVGSYPGAGDVFASVVTAAFMKGIDFTRCVQLAMGFTGEAVSVTERNGENVNYGLCFEPLLPKLIRAVKHDADA